jgi:5'-methylthioadenosine phosphorylase
MHIKIGIIGGSGFEDPELLTDARHETVSTPFGKPSDVLIHGNINGVPCVILSRHGRSHSLSPSQVPYRANIWALHQAGCTHILATTACGSLKEHIAPGEPVIIDQFINRTFKRETTFYDQTVGGPQGVCHMPMHTPFCAHTRQILLDVAAEQGLKHHASGTTVCIEGPAFSSRAESFMYKSWGADLVTMTTVPEVPLAKELGMCYASIALPTDYDCWHDEHESVSVDLVMKTFADNKPKVLALIKEAVKRVATADWTKTFGHNKQMVKTAVMC